MKILSFLFPQTLANFSSKFNHEILVKEFFGKKYIDVGGLMQSGRIVRDLFQNGLKKLGFSENDPQIKKILVLGLGGGTVIERLTKWFPKARLTAVEIDPVMVGVAGKYFDLIDIPQLTIKIGDVFDRKLEFGKDYNLIIVDVFKGYDIPEALSETRFLCKLKSVLAKNGVVIFNRLYFQKYVFEADKFLDKVGRIFQDVKRTKVYLNLLICAR